MSGQPIRLEIRHYSDLADVAGVTYVVELRNRSLDGLPVGAVITGQVVEIRRQVVER